MQLRLEFFTATARLQRTTINDLVVILDKIANDVCSIPLMRLNDAQFIRIQTKIK